jgi:hypothetical protein
MSRRFGRPRPTAAAMTPRRLCRSLGAAIALASAALALRAPSALATFHLMQVREVYPGSAGNPDSEYVELQMYTSGQQFVMGHVIRTYNASGAVTGEGFFSANVAQGANQSTILMATSQAEAQFGVAADGAMSSPGQLDPAGGAVCWETIDCVSWGAFGGSLPSPAGQPATPTGIPDGMALRRTIAPSCPTLLEATDDHDNSALDFQAVFPGPRPNSVTPTEHPCTGQSGSAGEGPSTGSYGAPPQTRITKAPGHVTTDRTPTFRFAANRMGAQFLCRIDRSRFRRCRSPFTTKRLSPGRHVFEVKARSPGGAADPSPAVYRFMVRR